MTDKEHDDFSCKKSAFMHCLMEGVGGLIEEMPDTLDPVSVYFDGGMVRLICFDPIKGEIIIGTAAADDDSPITLEH